MINQLLYTLVTILTVSNCFSQITSFDWLEDIPGGNVWIYNFVYDGNDGLYITGRFWDSIAIGEYHLYHPNSAFNDMYMAKYDTSGKVLWVWQAHAIEGAWGNNLEIGPNGHVYMFASVFAPGINTNEVQIIPQYNGVAALFEFEPDGQLVDYTYIDGGGVGAQALSIDPTGNIYLTCNYSSWVYLPNDTLYTNNQNEVIVLLDTALNVVWGRNLVSSSWEHAFTLASVCDSTGNLYLTGYCYTQQWFDSLKLSGPDSTEDHTYIVKIDPTGKVVWLRTITGTDGIRYFEGMAVIRDDLYISGSFGGDSVIINDNLILKSGGGNDYLYFSYKTDGMLNWVRHGGGRGVARNVGPCI